MIENIARHLRSLCFVVAGMGWIDRDDGEILGTKSGIDCLSGSKSLQEQTRADQEQKRNRDLRDDQKIAEIPSAKTADGTGRALP